jgi:hypothetical protein
MKDSTGDSKGKFVDDGVKAANKSLHDTPKSVDRHRNDKMRPVGSSANQGYKHE